ncbi:MAG: hypothetical protein AAGH78_03050 [Cyanobacteria bacterium P01_H01_bin.58]
MAFDPAALKRSPHTYQTTATASRIKLDCQAIAEFDKKLEKQASLATTLIIVGVAALFLSFLGSALLGNAVLLYVILPFALGAIITGGVLNLQTQGLRIPDNRYQVVPELVDTLSRDMEENAVLHLQLNCMPTTHKLKKLDTIPHPSRPGRRGWKIDRFQDNWLTLGGAFVDGTNFSLAVIERAIAKYGWKRSRSGKRKFKRKEKSKGVELSLDLHFPRKRYGAIQILQQEVSQAIQLPPQVHLKRLKISDRSFFLSIQAPPEFVKSHALKQLVTQLLLNAYHVLNLAKQLSKRTS